MSLHKFADMVASKGRGDDSLLIHMTPDEVQRLQKFAEANGRSLTINPDTGLPEAGMLSDLFKAVAPIALGAFLGPAGAALGGGFMSAGMAGLTVGGLTTLATGSLSRGLMAGLGAYGGAGLGESLMGAGTGSLAATDIAAQQAAGGFPSLAQGATQEQIAKYATDVGALRDAAVSKAGEASLMSKASAGLGAIADNPAAYGKDLFKYGSAAAMPIMAGAMVPTTTKMPENTNPAYIRQKLYDPYTQTYKSLTPVKASEFGSRNFSDAYTNPQTGQMATLDQRQPTPMAGGGIVALAGGGVPGFAGNQGSLVNDQQIFDYFKGLDQSKVNSGALDAQIAKDMQTYNVSAADIARATGTQANQGNFETRFVNAVAQPGITADQFNAYTADVGLTGKNLATALQNSGLSQAAQYSLTHGLNDAAGIVGAPKSAQDLYNAFGYQAGDLRGDVGGLAGYYSNINQVAGGLQSLIDSGKLTVQQAQNLSLAEMERLGMNQKDIKAATGKAFGDLFKAKEDKKVVTPITTVTPTGYYGNDTGNVLTRTPGDITTNKDGTVTVQPNIPGRPIGGFPGMASVRDAYTAGGGSLGYTAPIPKDPEAYFNKMTDDSLDAYNFLMGKGKNLTQVNAAKNRPLMQPYFTGANRYKPKFLSYDKDGNVVSSDGSKNTSGAAGTTKVINADGTINQEATDKANFDYVSYLKANPDVQAELDKGIANFGNKDDLASAAYNHYIIYGKAQKRPLKAAGGGMMGYAMGGGLGSLGSYSDGGRLLKGPGDGVSDSIPATIGRNRQPARLADGEFVIPARIVSELGNGSTDAGAKKLYAMMDRVQKARGKTTGKNKVAANSRADKHLPA